eukprot:TRINITY_DN186609_c0_g1_i1.p3 TRINITY_DN186609_c0_g1~~TRINITY_DN186609_c0_g1_i1.p3  ORF type:complete len:130 (+),score=0.93 TRINITY_DN186609_c0_g1_i1:28-417(+)
MCYQDYQDFSNLRPLGIQDCSWRTFAGLLELKPDVKNAKQNLFMFCYDVTHNTLGVERILSALESDLIYVIFQPHQTQHIGIFLKLNRGLQLEQTWQLVFGLVIDQLFEIYYSVLLLSVSGVGQLGIEL